MKVVGATTMPPLKSDVPDVDVLTRIQFSMMSVQPRDNVALTSMRFALRLRILSVVDSGSAPSKMRTPPSAASIVV